MGDPKFCIFDEPSLGLAPIVIQQIGETLQKMRALNLTVLLIEQNAMLASHVADRIYIMSAGRVQFHDTPASLMQNPEVIEKFLSAWGMALDPTNEVAMKCSCEKTDTSGR